ncbi:hypothetical protein [Bisbaumannia pacifica]|uniref:Uncharacterized protein n=1 Tax=Bisbaumannia pacifica TaxID=77098 RepID=A0ABD4KWY2_9GAMM|nr:hypothetical protein [Halomonas pacifica]MBH8578803.1 hypothetical protein [Halomonas pacifica]
MDITFDDIGPVLITLPLLGLIVMTVVPVHWQTVQGWLLVSYVGLPLFIVAIALVVNLPGLLFLLLLLAGIKSR